MKVGMEGEGERRRKSTAWEERGRRKAIWLCVGSFFACFEGRHRIGGLASSAAVAAVVVFPCFRPGRSNQIKQRAERRNFSSQNKKERFLDPGEVKNGGEREEGREEDWRRYTKRERTRKREDEIGSGPSVGCASSAFWVGLINGPLEWRPRNNTSR